MIIKGLGRGVCPLLASTFGVSFPVRKRLKTWGKNKEKPQNTSKYLDFISQVENRDFPDSAWPELGRDADILAHFCDKENFNSGWGCVKKKGFKA